MRTDATWTLTDSGYGRAPTLVCDGRGRCLALWISWVEGRGERVMASEVGREGPFGEPSPLTSWFPAISGFAATTVGRRLALALIAHGEPGRDGLLLGVKEGLERPIALAPVVPARLGPAQATLASHGNRLLVACTVRELGGRRLKLWQTSTTRRSSPEEIPLSAEGGFHAWPSLIALGGRALLAYQRQQRGRCEIVTALVETSAPEQAVRMVVAAREGGSTLACPTLLPDGGGGAYLAWQTDALPGGTPGLVRATEIVRVDGQGRSWSLATALPDVEVDGRGEDQGFEAPSLFRREDGLLVVVGRGSQGIHACVLDANGSSGPFRLDDPGWACRGRRFSCFIMGDHLLVLGRERPGLVLRRVVGLPGPTAGPLVAEARSSAEVAGRVSLEPRPHFEIGGRRVLFGDPHQHTARSDGTGTVEEALIRARFRYRDDFVSITDHESFLGKRTPPGEWGEICRIVDEAYDPGQFVTLHGFEWTGARHPGPGHKVVYLPPDGGPVLSREDEETRASRGLLSQVKRLGGLAVPHHAGWTGADLANHDPGVQPVWEIVSCHGSYERRGQGPIGTRGDDLDGQFVGDALDLGLRFGFIGGSDGHGLAWHHGICRVADSHRTGLAAVFAEEPTRQGILEALRRRRCYATSGTRIGLWFEVDGRPMGEEIVSAQPVRFVIMARGTAELEALSLVTNGGRELELECAGREVEVTGMLEPPSVGGWSYWYVRVVQRDGQVAWSSPVWIDAPQPA